jgi:hexosaminidase
MTGYSDSRLERAVKRFTMRVSRQTGIPLVRSGTPASTPNTLLVECRQSAPEYPSLNEDESYQLDISASGARLTSQTTTGALRGLETFGQLIHPDKDSFEVQAVQIDDQPRFPWRGLMFDVSRHWMPVPVIERNLDAMAMVKLNVLHWHLADDQGFRVESKRFPRLHQLGSDGNFYTQAEVRHIVSYANDRGIRVIPEFDMPGHTTSWFVGYPELASAPGPYEIERKWGIFEPTMDPAREETYTFLEGFLAEMAGLFPDPYFHIGGDEVEDAQWKRSATIQAFAQRHGIERSHGLHAYFNKRVQELLRKYGKTMVGWDEVLNPELPADTVIQSWRGQESLAAAAQKGYRGILSFGYYLDYLKPAAVHYAVDPLGAAGKLDRDQIARILGGEACLWSEYMSPETVDSRIWPRMAAIAERLWSPAQVSDIDAMYARLSSVSRVLDFAGVTHRANYAHMLDRLAGSLPPEPIRVLADAVDALGIEVRRDARKYTSQVPLNRLVDAARPESETVHMLEQAARQVAAGGRDLTLLRYTMAQWQAIPSLLRPDNHLLRELIPISQDLAVLGSIGLKALDCLEAGHPAPDGWIVAQRQLLAKIEQPKAEVSIAAVRPVRILLDALSRQDADNKLK